MQNNKKAATQKGAALTTLEARRRLDCLHPAARVMELRNLGFLISTIWQVDHTPEGMPHRVARYCLLSEPTREAV